MSNATVMLVVDCAPQVFMAVTIEYPTLIDIVVPTDRTEKSCLVLVGGKCLRKCIYL